MKFGAIAGAIALIFVAPGADAQAPSGGGLSVTGTPTSGYAPIANGNPNVAVWGAASGGGSVSVTAGNAGIVITPTPGTGTFTVGLATALPGTTTATTQAAGDTSTLVATDAFTAGIFAAPPGFGTTTPASVAATTLSASGAVSGAGFSAYLASPPAIGGTAAAAISATTLSATTISGAPNFSGTPTFANALALGASTATTQAAGTNNTTIATTAFTNTIFAVPPVIGSTTPTTGNFTTLDFTAGSTAAVPTNTLVVTGVNSPASIGSGGALLRNSGSAGFVAGGNGSASDLVLENSALASVVVIPHATSNIYFAGTTTAASVEIANVASAVDSILLTGSATGTPGNVTVAAQGADTNVNINVTAKGTGQVVLNGNATTNNNLFVAGSLFAASSFTDTVSLGEILIGGLASLPTFVSGSGSMYVSTTNGLMEGGYGSTYDVSLFDSAGAVAMGILHGTTGISFAGSLTFAGLGTGTATKYVCLTSANVVVAQTAAC